MNISKQNLKTKPLYLIFILLSIVVLVYVDWINLKEVIDRSAGKNTLFSQMSWLTDKQAMWYSIGFLIPFLTLTIFLFYLIAKKKNKIAVIVSIVALLLIAIQFYTDYLVQARI